MKPERIAPQSRQPSAALPYPDARFDAVFAVHVVYFWTDALADLREIRRVLRPGGRALLGYRPRDAQAEASLPASVYMLRSVEETEELLRKAGLDAASSTMHALSGGAAFACTKALHR